MEVQELERYIKEDVERYGNKITELEKKLSQAYREVEVGPIDDALASDRDALVAYVALDLNNFRTLLTPSLCHQWCLGRRFGH